MGKMNLLNQDLISIITATYNSADFIEETYNSIKEQTHINWEWLVTDDCSNDNTVSLLKNMQAKDERIKIFYNNMNSGAAVSRNNSLKESSGKYIAFIDSDDTWMPDKLEKQIEFMDEGIDFSFTAFQIVKEDSTLTDKIIDLKKQAPLGYKDMLKKKATLGCSTVMLRAERFPNLQMPLLRTGQDYATWLMILKSGTKAYLLPDALTRYRIVSNSISRNKYKKAKRQWQIYRSVERLSLTYSIFCFVNYAIKAIVR